MNETRSLKMTSTLDGQGRLTVQLVEDVVPAPVGEQLLLRIDAAPINPSDLGLLFGPADVGNAQFTDGRVLAAMPETAMKMMTARIGLPMAVGNEGAGRVVAAGDSPAAQALLGKLVAYAAGGGMYAQYRLVDARQCLALPEGATAEQGASSFVNPMTALGFVETLKRSGHTGLVHTAAASNLGQMLVKICREDGIPLVNIVRSDAQAALLRGLGAEHVVDSARDDFEDGLATALEATGATLAFDAIGGGTLISRIFAAMEHVASRGGSYSRYGSDRPKQAYIYGGLDSSPTMLARNFGFSWSLGGWLLTPFLEAIGPEATERLGQRVRDNLTTTFASPYKARLSLRDALKREAVLAYNARRTGEKYLILPHGTGM